MPHQLPDFDRTFERFIAFHEDYIERHVHRIRQMSDPQYPSVRPVLPLWERLTAQPLKRLVAQRMVGLLKDAIRTSQLKFSAERHNELWLIVSVVPALDGDDVGSHFGKNGYMPFTMAEGGAAKALSNGDWVAHWTLCTDGTESPTVHLTVLPPRAMYEAGPALMMWAQDLFTPTEWSQHVESIDEFLRQYYRVSDENCRTCPLDTIFMERGRQVVKDPNQWDSAAEFVHRRIAPSFPGERIEALWESSRAVQFVAPQPLGFVATALAFEMLTIARPRDIDLLSQVCTWALWHPLYDERLMPIRIRLCDWLLQYTNSTEEPRRWAALHQTCGVSYAGAASGIPSANLDQAISHFQTALSVLTRTDEPHLWAGLQNNLGHAYAARHDRDRDKNIERAIHCHEQALSIFSSDEHSRDWAETQQFLGIAYAVRILGDRSDNLERAIRSFERALQVRTRDESPERWAETQGNLGGAYLERIRGNRTENIETAIEHCNAAVTVFSRDNLPTKFANTQNTLANAYCERLSGERAENLEAAITCYKAALDVYTPDVMPYEWARAQNNLGTAYDDRIRGDRDDNCENAIQCYRLALTVRSPASSPMEWSVTCHNLGSAYSSRARGNRAENIEEAIRCYEAALTVRTCESSPIEWAMTQSDLGYAFIQRIRGNRSENLEMALAHLESSLLIRSRSKLPAQWAQTWNNVGNVYSERLVGDHGENLAIAARCYRESAEVYRELGIRREAVRSYRNLAAVEMQRQDWEKACNTYESAAELVETELHGSQTEMGRLAWLREEAEVYDGLVASYLSLALQGGVQQPNRYIERACYWSERSRARCLSDLIARAQQIPHGVDPAAFHQFQAAMNELRDLDQQLESLERTRAGFERHHPRRKSLDEQISETWSTRERIHQTLISSREQFSQSDPAWLSGAVPLSVDSMKRIARKAGAALLTLRPTRWGTCVLIILPSGELDGTLLKDVTIEWISQLLVHVENGTPIGGWVVAYHQLQQSSEHQHPSNLRMWHETMNLTLEVVGSDLWQPLNTWLAKVYPSSRQGDAPPQLIVLAGIGLNILPLHAAWWIEEGRKHWACDDYQISYAPSIAVLDNCLRRQEEIFRCPDFLLAVRNPTGDLQWAEWEVDSVCALMPSHAVLGKATDPRPATRLNLREALPRTPVALIATHGTYNLRDPWLRAGLCTADGDRGEPGQPYFALRDLFALDLSHLWIVVLSSCESSLSDYRDPAGEQLGLPAAFLAAGAMTAIGSLWNVDDFATALLSRKLFEELLSQNTSNSLSKASALWKAQSWLRELTINEAMQMQDMLTRPYGAASSSHRAERDMVRMAEHPDDSRMMERPFEHPCFWSAFTCHGAP